jgi:alpha-D-xyloside xylohydrolase
VPLLWSFGFWMSRITYKSEEEVRDVAAKLREHKVPADVIHLDTGWFETDWRSNYQFSTSRFHDPAKMIADLVSAVYSDKTSFGSPRKTKMSRFSSPE